MDVLLNSPFGSIWSTSIWVFEDVRANPEVSENSFGPLPPYSLMHIFFNPEIDDFSPHKNIWTLILRLISSWSKWCFELFMNWAIYTVYDVTLPTGPGWSRCCESKWHDGRPCRSNKESSWCRRISACFNHVLYSKVIRRVDFSFN